MLYAHLYMLIAFLGLGYLAFSTKESDSLHKIINGFKDQLWPVIWEKKEMHCGFEVIGGLLKINVCNYIECTCMFVS